MWGFAVRAKWIIGVAAIVVCSWQAARPAAQGLPTTFHEPTWSERMGASFKRGTNKIGGLVKPKPDPAEEAELQPDKKPGPGVYVALAELQEGSGNIPEAEV